MSASLQQKPLQEKQLQQGDQGDLFKTARTKNDPAAAQGLVVPSAITPANGSPLDPATAAEVVAAVLARKGRSAHTGEFEGRRLSDPFGSKPKEKP